MSTKCQNCPLRARPLFDEMSEAEVSFMQQFKSGELTVVAGTTLMMEGSNSPQLFTVLDGMGLRYKSLMSGERQVINFVFPGDFLGLQAGVMGEMQHSVEASTDMRLCIFDRKSLWGLFRDHPRRAYDLTWIAAVEEHFLGESLAIIGHMSGIQRVARALVRVHDRCTALGLRTGNTVPFPFKQQDLADSLGLSLVHTNKTLAKLRKDGVANWRHDALTINDYEKLCDIAEMDPDREPVVRPLI